MSPASTERRHRPGLRPARLVCRLLCGSLLGLAPGALLQTTVHAQSRTSLTPSISFGQFYDDNLFSTPTGQQGDTASRISPSLDGRYDSPLFDLDGRYSFDTELYADHPDLNRFLMRQDGTLSAHYTASPAWFLTADGSVLDTYAPEELTLTNGLAVGRQHARQVALDASVVYRLTLRNQLSVDDQFVNDALIDSMSSRMNETTFRLEHASSARTTVGLGYRLREFDLGGGLTSTSSAFLAGWEHALSPLTHVQIWAGPRIEAGGVHAEVSASLTRELESGSLSLACTDDQANTLGDALPLEVRALTVGLTRQFGRPLTISVTPGLYDDIQNGASTVVYAMAASVTRRLVGPLALAGSYQFTSQHGWLNGQPLIVPHQVVMLTLVVAPDARSIQDDAVARSIAVPMRVP
jgi:hypothetical protein